MDSATLTTHPRPNPGPFAGFPISAERGSFRFISGIGSADLSLNEPMTSWVELMEAPWDLQARAIYEKLDALTQDAGGVPALLRLHLYQKDKRLFPVLESVRFAYEGDQPAPSCALGLATLHADDAVLHEMDAIAISAAGLASFGPRSVIAAGNAGKSASHYSQFSRLGPYVFMAGVIPIDPVSMQPITGFSDIPAEGRFLARGRSHPDSRTGPIAAQTWFVYQRIFRGLEGIGVSPQQIIGASVFLSGRGDTADFLRVHDRLFGGGGPSLNIVYVDEVGHLGNRIEIEVTAVEGQQVRHVHDPATSSTQPPLVSIGGELAIVSDQLGTDSAGNLIDGPQDLDHDDREFLATVATEGLQSSAQLLVALRNLRRSIDAAGLSLEAIGHLYVRLKRPGDRTVVAPLVRHVLERNDMAITVLDTFGIPQSEAAVVSVSATLAGIS